MSIDGTEKDSGHVYYVRKDIYPFTKSLYLEQVVGNYSFAGHLQCYRSSDVPMDGVVVGDIPP
jgi:hypothetical protein